jgi:UDP-N-acetyl-D-mannosaminuronic acid dehydrogenase
MNILIVGGGFVGLTLAAKLLKTKKHKVTVLEINPEKINNFYHEQYGIYEPGLDEILSSSFNDKRLRFIQNIDNTKINVVFVCVNTNKAEANRLEKQISMINLLADNLISSGHIYLRSTVPVGTTAKIYNAIQSSPRNDIKIFYAPERTAEGVALKELDSLPQIIGSPESTSLKIGADMLSTLGFEIIETTNSETAEFIKLMCNIWRDSTFAISNEFAIISESLNLDVFEIIEKANFQYPRATVPKPGPVGGPCLSKDTYLFFESLDQSLHKNSIILRSRKQNEKLVDLAFNVIHKYLETNPERKKVCFLGATFKGKPRTNDFRNSFTQDLINMLNQHNLEIKVWDPTLTPPDLLEHSNLLAKDLKLDNFDIIVIGNNANFISETEVTVFLESLLDSALIVDMWGVTRELKNIKANIYRFGVKV